MPLSGSVLTEENLRTMMGRPALGTFIVEWTMKWQFASQRLSSDELV